MKNPMAALEFQIIELDKTWLSQLLDIERKSFGNPWSKTAFISEMGLDYSFTIGITDPGETTLYAFSVFWLVEDEIHILNIAVNPEFRRQGFAKVLIDYILGQAHAVICQFVYLEVRINNLAAISLYEKTGFTLVGKRPRYYSDTGEDALLYTYYLKETDNNEED